MKNISIFFLLLLVSGAARAQVWSITELPETLNGLSIATHGNKIIMAGAGTIAGNAVSDTVYIYDAVTGEFEITHLPIAREAMAVVTLGDKVMFAGGAVFTVGVGFSLTTDTVQVYDLNTGEWSIEKLSAPRRWVTAQAINGKAYFAGGREPSGPYTDVLDIYDPATDTWALDTLPLPVRSAASAVAGDKLLLFLENNCQILNTATGEWEVVDLPGDRGFGIGVVTTPDEIWFIGGSSYLPIIDIYNIADGTWTDMNMLVPRYSPAVCYLNGKIIIAGGDDGSALTKIVETWDTETNEWVGLTELSSPRCYMNWECSAPVIGNSAYFPGGYSNFDFTMAAQVMDIYTDTSGMTSGFFTPVLKNISIQTFPSPFSKTFSVQVDFSELTSGTLEVFDLSGRQLFLEKVENQQVWNKTIAAKSWAAGAYLLKVRTEEGIAIQKIVKQ